MAEIIITNRVNSTVRQFIIDHYGSGSGTCNINFGSNITKLHLCGACADDPKEDVDLCSSGNITPGHYFVDWAYDGCGHSAKSVLIDGCDATDTWFNFQKGSTYTADSCSYSGCAYTLTNNSSGTIQVYMNSSLVETLNTGDIYSIYNSESYYIIPESDNLVLTQNGCSSDMACGCSYNINSNYDAVVSDAGGKKEEGGCGYSDKVYIVNNGGCDVSVFDQSNGSQIAYVNSGSSIEFPDTTSGIYLQNVGYMNMYVHQNGSSSIVYAGSPSGTLYKSDGTVTISND